MSSEPEPKPYRWIMLTLLGLLYFSFGLITRSIAPLVTPILKDLSMNYSQMGAILGSWQLIYIIVSLGAGTIIDKWGVRKSLLVGVTTIGLSALLRSLPEGFIGMLFAVAIFGVGGPMISIGCPKTISEWFQGKERGMAVGIYMSGSYAGMFMALTLTNSVIMPLMGGSWRFTFVCYASVAFTIALLWWFFAKEAQGAELIENPGILEMLMKLMKIRNVRIVLMMGLLSFATLHGFSIWLPKILEANGLSPTHAGFVAAIPIISGIPALLFFPRIIPPTLRHSFIALSSLLIIVTLYMIVTASGTIQIVVLLLYGITGSGFLPILTLILMDTPEVESRWMGSAGGLFFCISEIGGFAGPLMMGFLVDLTDTFLSGAILFSILNIVILILTFMLKTKEFRRGGP